METAIKSLGTIDGGVNTSHDNSSHSNMSIVSDFHGMAKPNLRKASAIMTTGVFDDNENIQSLFRKASNSENKLKKETVKVTLAEKHSNSLKVFASIKSSILGSSIGGDFETIKNSSKETEVEFIVIFDE